MMKVLWITNNVFPEAVGLLTHNKYEIRETGGWLNASANELSKLDDIKLSVATVSSMVKKLTAILGEHIHYYFLPLGKGNSRYNEEYEPLWKELKSKFNPDLVHIHGTEYTHGLAYVNACGSGNVVVSIQGMPSVICDYLYSGIPRKDILRATTFKDIVRGNLIQHQKKIEKNTKICEGNLLRKVRYVIGRTSWDRAHTWALNSELKYYHCDETLRPEFYEGQWTYEKCERNTLFLSQASRALKGAHQLLKAMPFILRSYPDTIIRIAGNDITEVSSFREKLGLTGYGRILRQMIDKYELHEKIKFLGPLNADKMKMEYLKSNVFVSPSSIENSPNSLCEAQLLGVPCVASYVGGTMDFIPDSRYGKLYRFDDVEMLAKCVCDFFNESYLYNNEVMRSTAQKRHEKEKNLRALLDIYCDIKKY